MVLWYLIPLMPLALASLYGVWLIRSRHKRAWPASWRRWLALVVHVELQTLYSLVVIELAGATVGFQLDPTRAWAITGMQILEVSISSIVFCAVVFRPRILWKWIFDWDPFGWLFDAPSRGDASASAPR